MRRRSFLGLAAGVAGGTLLWRADYHASAQTVDPPVIQPRVAWAGDLAPTGAILEERPEDVQLLLVHHTAGANGYTAAEVPATLRGIFGLHTGPEKGWPDVAYNFFVDAHGGIWEGRAGSTDRPVMGDATGGSQGHTLLCCFVGDHTTEAPSIEAHDAMARLLAWLADQYNIDTTPGATTTFTSRGSNRWPPGTSVTAATISGHRDMSQTICPGDAAYRLVTDEYPAEVSALRAKTRTTTTTTTTAAVAPTATAPPPSGNSTLAVRPADDDTDDWVPPIGAGLLAAGAGGLAVGAAIAIRRRRTMGDS